MATTTAGNPYHSGPGNAAPTNGLGIAGFVLSLIGILLTCGTLNIISLPVSLVALAWKPRGFAIAGTIISVLGIGFLALVGWGIVAGFMGLKGLADLAGQQIQTQSVISDAKNAIENYRSENNTLPDGIEGNKLVVEKKDGWGTELRYDLEGDSYLIRSAGPDKKFNTSDDVTSKDTSEMEVETNLDINVGEDGMPSDGPVLVPETSTTIPGIETTPEDGSATTPEKADDSE